MLPRLLLPAVLVALLPAPAAAARADDEARATGSCGRGASSELRLQDDGSDIRVEFEVDANRGGQRWRVTLVHERRVVWRGSARTRSGSGAFRVRRWIDDYDGVDEVTARASGPGGTTCTATARLEA